MFSESSMGRRKWENTWNLEKWELFYFPEQADKRGKFCHVFGADNSVASCSLALLITCRQVLARLETVTSCLLQRWPLNNVGVNLSITYGRPSTYHSHSSSISADLTSHSTVVISNEGYLCILDPGHSNSRCSRVNCSSPRGARELNSEWFQGGDYLQLIHFLHTQSPNSKGFPFI